MTPEELRLAAHLLDMASEEFGNHGCNDFDMASLASPETRDALVAEFYADDPDYNPTHVSGPDYRLMDWMAMDLMADKMRQEADSSEAGS